MMAAMRALMAVWPTLLFCISLAAWGLTEDEKNTIKVFQQSVKSVVNITNVKTARRGWPFLFDTVELPAGVGSGIVWDTQGHIVTNYHVVAGADTFWIRFYKDTKQYRAKIIGGEPKKDVAVLKLQERPRELFAATMGESSTLAVGQKSLAIGSPFELDHTLTTGVISALGRKIQGHANIQIYDMIQTDSAINRGNSGGPLLNSSGEVIGMNTMIYSSSGSSAGVGFAVPADTIKRLVPQLIKYGKVIQPGLGVAILGHHYYQYFNLRPNEGAIVRSVMPKSSAQRAGIEGISEGADGRLHLGDTIVAIDNKPIKNFHDIFNILGTYAVGDEVKVTLRRGRREIRTVDVKLMQINN